MNEFILKYGSLLSVIVALVALLTTFCARLLYRDIRRKKTRKALIYNQILKSLESLHREGGPETHRDGALSPSRLSDFLLQMVDKYKQAFDDITDSNCRISIKVISIENHQPVLKTIARDTDSSSSIRSQRNSRKNYLTNDSASLSIVLGQKGFYMNNDLSKSKSYKGGGIPENKAKEWPLPYRSTLVVPIRNHRTYDSDDIFGFLLIDSDKRNVFDETTDPDLATALAETLIPYVSSVKETLVSKA